jgi:FG-GAP-like repeat
LSAADIDADGRPDLVTGTRWLRQNANGDWSAHDIRQPPGRPDRHRVADLDADGRLDVVVGFEAVNMPGTLAWYRRGRDPRLPWKETVIARVIGPMSLDVGDMDGDGDLDVIVGEHNVRHPAAARLLWFENLDGDGRTWAPRSVHVGDEHHDGALVVDLDNDGDLDIVSIGWGHDRLLVFENLSINRN